MRKVFLDDLPRYKSGSCKGKINWIKCIGHKVKFIYDDIIGDFNIVDYIKQSQYIHIQYLSNICKIKTYCFTGCKIKEVLKIENYSYDESNPRRVDLRNLEKTSRGIKWDKSIGANINFYYDGLFGVIKIIRLSNKNKKIVIQYLNDILEMQTGSFIQGKLSELLGKYIHISNYDISQSKRVDLRNLPMYKQNIDWVNSVGYKVDFVYNNIEGVLEILDCIKIKNKYNLKLKYLNNEYNVTVENFKHANFAFLKEGNRANYLYSIGDIINMKNGKIEILKLGQYKSGIQNYTIRCLKCGHISTTDKKGILNKSDSECINCSKNKFKLSDDNTYWIGTTQDGFDFWFDGNEETISYVKSYTWRKTCYDYFQNKKGDKLHRIIMGVTDPNVYINHLGRNRWDNRKENLTVSDCLDNSKEKRKSSRNKTGIVGLMKRGKNNKYVGNIKVNDICLYSSYKERDDALIDLLIMQREYGFRHNENLYYLLENVPQERMDEVLNLIKRQLGKERNDKLVSSNQYEISECGTYYNVYDSNNNRFKISVESKEIVEKGLWYVATEKSNNVSYVHGSIIIEGSRKTVKLHRYLFDLLDVKYKNIFVDHLNGDGLDNRRDNLQLTDANGNGQNKPAKGYWIDDGRIRGAITINGKSINKTFETIKDAINWHTEQRKISINNRLTFTSKSEVDEYIKSNQLPIAI